jgi:hypothetical protein
VKLLYYVRTARKPLSTLKFLPADSLLYFQTGVFVPPAPAPVTPTAAGGGVSLVHPRRLPFWSRETIAGSAVLLAPGATVAASGRVEQDELTGDDNQVLGLL